MVIKSRLPIKTILFVSLIIVLILFISLLNRHVKLVYAAKESVVEIGLLKKDYLELMKNKIQTFDDRLELQNLSAEFRQLKDFISDSSMVFIFVYNEYACRPCSSSLLDEFISTAKKNNLNQTIICNFQKHEDFISFCRINSSVNNSIFWSEFNIIKEQNNTNKSLILFFNNGVYKGLFYPARSEQDLLTNWMLSMANMQN